MQHREFDKKNKSFIKTFYCIQLVSEPILQGSVDDTDARDARALMHVGITE